jgi:lysophospholipase L1-like esterase
MFPGAFVLAVAVASPACTGSPTPSLGTGAGGAPWSADAGSTGGTPLSGGSSNVSGGAPSSGGLPTNGGATQNVTSGGSAAGGQNTSGGASSPSGGGAALGGAGGANAGGSANSDGPIAIWLAGDSTVAGGNTPCPRGWGRHFDEQFDDRVSVMNSASGGKSVRTWLYSVTTTMGADGECNLDMGADGKPVLAARWTDMLTNMKTGDYLFIQFGINDGSATCDRHVGLETFKKEYGMMAAEAAKRGVQPVFVTPVSSIACSGTKAIGTRGEFVTATLDAGEQFGVPVIDLHALSVAHYQSLGFCPVPGGDVSASTTGPVGDYFCDDHTHFSEAGSVDMARLVAGAVLDGKLPLASYLAPGSRAGG